MLSRIFGFGRSNFETYLTNLVRSGAQGTPTADEARQDFRAAIVARAGMPRFKPNRGSSQPTDPQPLDCI